MERTHPLAGLILPVLILSVAMIMMFGGSVLAPVTLALFVISMVWPMQSWLSRRLPTVVALLITTAVIVMVTLGFASLIVWALSRVVALSLQDASSFQTFYARMLDTLDGYGFATDSLWSDKFDARWVIRRLQGLTGRVNSTLAFLVIAVVYVTLGLLEVVPFRNKLLALGRPDIGAMVLQGCIQSAAKIRRYMFVRSLMSVLTGLLAFSFVWSMGVENAVEWGVVTFVLNYIPFLGPMVATLFPTSFALIQFESWQTMLLVFVGLNLIQTAVGSYLEPLVSGAALSISPTVVVFSVVLWAFFWGIYGAFIGVPIMIVLITFCSLNPSAKWISDLLGRKS